MAESSDRRPLRDVLKEHAGPMLAIPGVIGAAEGEWEGEPCIRVLVEARTRDLENALPDLLEGYPVRIVETGDIRAL